MPWACEICTFANENDTFLACAACGSERSLVDDWDPFVPGANAGTTPPNSSTPVSASSNDAPKRPARAAPKVANPSPSPILQQQGNGKGKTAAPIHSATSSTAQTANKNDDALKPIIQELVETERIYVKELEAVITVFLEPLKARAQETDTAVLTESEVNSIFGNLAEISRVNKELVNSFDKALKEHANSSSVVKTEAVCKSFRTYAPHLKMYAAYAIYFETSQEKLKRFEQERYRFSEFIHLAGAMNDVIKDQPLSSFLIKPIQRICKYPLFFHQMIKAINPSDYEELSQLLKVTLDSASEVAFKINADKLRAEQSLRAFEVARRMDQLADVVIEPGRRYVGEWKCLISVGNNSLAVKRKSMVKQMGVVGEKKPRTCFLFSNVLMITKEVGTGNKLRYELKLWMSLDQLQHGGIGLATGDPKSSREGSSSQQQQPSESNGNGTSGENQSADARLFRPKLFQLPLDILHVASTDREKCQVYREKQHQAQASLVTRRPSFLKKKASAPGNNGDSRQSHGNGQLNGGHMPLPATPASAADTVITAYTLWFRSGAERARVSTLLEKTISEFANSRLLSPTASHNAAGRGFRSNDVLPPVSPTRKEFTTQAGNRSFENLSLAGGGAGPVTKPQPMVGFRRTQSLDSGLEATNTTVLHAGGSTLSSDTFKQRATSDEMNAKPVVRTELRTSPLTFGLDPLHTNSPPKLELNPTTNKPSQQLQPAAAVLGKTNNSNARARPRPPAPPPPSVIYDPTKGTVRPSAPRPTINPNAPPVIPNAGPNRPASPDQLISKWFGE